MDNKALIQGAEHRIQQIRMSLQKKGIDCLLINHLPTIRYLTNFSGSYATLCITSKKVLFLTNDLYAEQIQHQLFKVKGLTTYITRDPYSFIAKEGLLDDAKTIGFESDKMSYATTMQVRKLLAPIKLVKANGIAQEVTISKTPEEINLIRKAADITTDVFNHIITLVKPGITEADLATEIVYQGRKRGAEKESFDIIVVSGHRSAMPHGRATDKKLENGDMITFDFGFYVEGFASDMTRSVMVGKANKEQKEVYTLIADCVEAANAYAKPGISGKELDAIARDKIVAAGYGDYFQHSLGHGLGIEVHESPAISWRNEKGLIPENAVITIEPGIYLPGKFGVRIEDDIVVHKNGIELLTKATKELLEL